jgi:hypothetical protein
VTGRQGYKDRRRGRKKMGVHNKQSSAPSTLLTTFKIFGFSLQIKPLIWIESVIERHAHSRVEIMVKAKSQFKRRSTANNVEIYIHVPNDADSPKFKTTIGHCKYVPEQVSSREK